MNADTVTVLNYSNIASFYFFIAIVLATPLSLLAGPNRTTYQAKIIKPDGFPLEAAAVNFRFTILDPTGSCVIYIENFAAINMQDSGGVVSFALGGGNRVFPTSSTTNTFAAVFDNATPSFSCQTSGNYTPTSVDARKIVMQFQDTSGWQTLPAMTINAVPYAMYATKAENSTTLNNKTDSAFVEYSTLASLSCSADQAIKFNGASFSCITVGSSGTAVTSATVTAALGYTPANETSFSNLNLSLNSVSSTVYSVSSTIQALNSTVSNLSNTVTSLSSTVAASFAAMTSSQWLSSGTSITYSSGYVGLGVANPVTRLDVSGGVRIGLESAICNTNFAGTLRYNSGIVEYCNGTSWLAFGVAGAGILSINGLVSGAQTFAIGSAGAAPNISSTGAVHTFNFPYASEPATTSGLISNSDYSLFSTVVSKIVSSAASIAQVLGYTPADQAAVTTLSSTVNSVSSTANSALATANAVSSTVTSLSNSVAASFAAISGSGITSFNGSASSTQTFAYSTAGTTTAFVTNNGVHTLNIPLASAPGVTGGLLSNADYITFTNKITSSAASIAQVLGYVPASATLLGDYLIKSNNLSDLSNTSAARTNLGLGSLATASTIDLGSSSATGNLAAARLPAFSGDVTSVSGSAALALTNSGVTAGTYSKVSVDAKGRVTSSSSLVSSDITTALGYTPASAAAATQWITSGTTINYSLGNVGVGIANPRSKFNVVGNPGIMIGDWAGGTMNNQHQSIAQAPSSFTDSLAEKPYTLIGGNSFLDRSEVLIGGSTNMASEAAAQNIIFYTHPTKDTALGVERMRVDRNGNVGIGTATPNQKLVVGDDIGNISGNNAVVIGASGSGNTQLFMGNDTNNFGNLFWDSANKDLVFRVKNAGTVNTSQFVLDASGSVGVGTASPISQMHLAKSGGTNLTISDIDGGGPTQGRAITLRSPTAASAAAVGTLTNHDLSILTGDAERMRITSSGNVGIGTSNPTTRLQVTSSNLSNGEYALVRYYDTNDATKGLQYSYVADGVSVTAARLRTYGLIPFYLGTSGNNSLLALVSDNVGIGTTTPAYKLDVNGAINATSVLVNGVPVGAGGTQWASGGGGVISYTGGSVGIGTSTPATMLNVAGTNSYNNLLVESPNYTALTARGGASSGWPILQLNHQGAGGKTWNIEAGRNSADSFGIYDTASATTRLSISSNGNVGIGTTSPSGDVPWPSPALDISGSRGTAILRTTAVNGLTTLRMTGPTSGSDMHINFSDNTGGLTFGPQSGYIVAMNIAKNGNIGIGAAASTAKLHINDGGTAASGSELVSLQTTYAANSAKKSITWRDPTNVTGSIDTRYNGSTVDMVFGSLYNGGYTTTDILTLKGTGNVGIGTNTPAYKLDVNGAINATSVLVNGVAVGAGGTQWASGSGGAISYTGGNVGIGTASPTTKLEVSGDILMSANPARLNFSGLTSNSFIQGTNTGGYLIFGANSAEVMRISGTNLGIGTTNPTQKLAVSDGTVNFFANPNSGNGADIGASTNHSLNLYTNNTERMRISAAGNVGIGTSNPNFNLHVNTSSDSGFRVSRTGLSGSIKAGISDGGGEAFNTVVPDDSYMTNDGGAFALGTAAAHAVKIGTNSVERVRIDSSGNVGIGTTNPSTTLNVAGKTTFEESVALGAGVTAHTINASNGSNNATSLALDVRANGASRLAVNASSGYVGIGTSSPVQALHVLGNTRSQQFIVDGGSWMSVGASAGADDLGFIAGSQERMTITNLGNVGIGTTSPSEKLHVVGNLRVQGSTDCTLGNGAGGTNCSSDERLKDNVKPIPYALEKINSLKGVEFDWNQKSKSFGRHDIGVIAQDVEKVFPTAVMIDQSTGYRKVDYAVLVAPLIQAVKEFFAEFIEFRKETNSQIRSLASAVDQKADKKVIEELKNENDKKQKEIDALKNYLCHKDKNAPFCK